MQSLKELFKIGKGPSSSHTMGPERAAKDFLSLCSKCSNVSKYSVTLCGSLACTGKGHLTDEAVLSVLTREKTEVIFDLKKKDLEHPNTLIMQAYDDNGKLILEKTYLSIGGGTICYSGEKLSAKEEVYPFKNFEEIRRYCINNGCKLEDVVFKYDLPDIRSYLRDIWQAMQNSIENGLKKDGELPGDLHVKRKASTLALPVKGEEDKERENRELCSFAFSTAEENASGGQIVTAPTCGASGVLPAVLMHMVKKYNISEDKIISALAVAGLIGNVVKTNASVSGAEAGCQAEIGTATAMAAAAACSVAGYSLEETEYAAEMALEHQLGLTCDPVHGYVQIPCIERNAVAAMRAIDTAELAHVLAGTRKISFDLIVKTMYETGKDLSERYRETSEGGLAVQFKIC